MVQDFPGVAFRQDRVSRGSKKTMTNQNGGPICSVQRREKRPKWIGSSGSLQMVQDFSDHFGSETFRWNELYHLNFQLEFSVFVDKW